ncbi:MAG: 2OG-Fe(II) oxygenase [Pseudomonadota bacterium]
MNPSADQAQPLTPELRAWMAEQTAQGHSMEQILQAIVTAGWSPDVAAAALQPGDDRLPALKVPALLPLQSGNMVDAGDKWVQVTYYIEQPELAVFGNLLSDGECDAIIASARQRLSRSLTVDTHTGGEELHPDRTSEGMFFDRGETEVIQRVEARIARLIGWPVKNGESLQVLRYPPGAEYKAHYDYFDPGASGTAAILKRGGQRVATLIMYLHEPDGGGATVFPVLGITVEPKRGTAVFFSYSRPHPCSLTLHGGEPVTAGEKWIATKWLREKEFV